MTGPSHGWPTVCRCVCGRLEQEHKDTGKRGTDNGQCSGFDLAAVEERPPPGVLRARLEAVLALHGPAEQPGRADLLICRECCVDWPCATDRAARGETR